MGVPLWVGVVDWRWWIGGGGLGVGVEIGGWGMGLEGGRWKMGDGEWE